jgi:cytochrome c oxidase assembly protein subunit 15
MDATTPLYDLSPALRVALLGLVLAIGPLIWVWVRHRKATPAARLRALTLLTLFLTFDLVLFGAFTRLTDSGLGCPDWPGCYGSASPLGAREEIHAAQTAMPTGPVTHGKAWVEMLHRYFATGVGALITALMAASWYYARRRVAALSPWWSTATFAWVCLQGAFGALTVTMKLYPAIVTLHLLGGMGLLVLLAVQSQARQAAPLRLSRGLHLAAWAVMGLSVLQIALGGWVSTNYAVLACTDFPTCQGQWWPTMDFEHGFAIFRELGEGKGGGYLPFAALVAIHYTHRLMAYAVLTAIAWLAWRLHRSADAAQRRFGLALAFIAAWQFASGLSNVVLGWPMVAALAHTGGAAALVTVLAMLLTRAQSSAEHAASPSHALPAGAAS